MAPRVGVLLAVAATAFLLLAAAPVAESALMCGQVYRTLTPCIGYLRSGGKPSPPCCSGVRELVRMAGTTADRQATCRCLKAAAQGFSGNIGPAASLPGSCGVTLPYKISTDTDCNKVS